MVVVGHSALLIYFIVLLVGTSSSLYDKDLSSSSFETTAKTTLPDYAPASTDSSTSLEPNISTSSTWLKAKAEANASALALRQVEEATAVKTLSMSSSFVAETTTSTSLSVKTSETSAETTRVAERSPYESTTAQRPPFTLPLPLPFNTVQPSQTTQSSTTTPMAPFTLPLMFEFEAGPNPDGICFPSESGEVTFGMRFDLAWDSFQEDRGECGHYRTWRMVAPPGHKPTIKIHSVLFYGNDTVTFYDGDAKIRELGTNSLKGAFAPILAESNHVTVKVLVALGNSKLSLSFIAHPSDSMPEKVRQVTQPTDSNEKYDCSAASSIPEALRCDMTIQCTDGRDEAGCAYRRDGSCGDWVPYGDHCLQHFYLLHISMIAGQPIVTMPLQAEQFCRTEHNATLALLPDTQGTDIVEGMLRHSGFTTATIGLRKVKPRERKLRHLYKHLWQWGDKGSPIAYEQQAIQWEGVALDCAMMALEITLFQPPHAVIPQQCSMPRAMSTGLVCMRRNPTKPETQHQKPPTVHFERPERVIDQFPTKACPDGSLVQTFHTCSWQDHAEHDNASSVWSESRLPTFQCQFGQSVHYTLVCDGNDDCPDRSDELSCFTPRLPPLAASSYVCRDGQTVPSSMHCDGHPDCFDESDEEECVSCGANMVVCAGLGCTPTLYAESIDGCPIVATYSHYPSVDTLPASVVMDGTGMSWMEPSPRWCLPFQFRCHNGLCIPSFLVNNGEKDCLYGEDEGIAKENVKCPGFYRCQEAGMCVHSKYVCDGVYHCPNKDDERYCDLECPQNCSCEGYAYTCSAMFHPSQHLQVRYLDLSGTAEPDLENIEVMEYMHFLNLSSCQLATVTLTEMRHLRVLDLSFNRLTGLAALNLTMLTMLEELDLSGNPFVKYLNSSFGNFLAKSGMHILKILTVRNTQLVFIADGVFSPLSELQALDLRGNIVERFDKNVFGGLYQLRTLYVDNHKLCCPYFHAPTSISECHAPQDELSSCSDLLRLDFFRVFLWTFSALAIVGNTGSLAYRLYTRSKHRMQQTYTVLVANLCVSDLLMGVYMMTIGAADAYFRSVYVSREAEWKQSAVCKMAGFLAFVSSEVSAFAICLVTLDRFLVLCFPLKSSLHLKSRSALMACAASWVVGVLLAAVPFMAQWDFYGQSGICLPLPITRQKYEGQDYAFAIFIVLNFVLFLLIGAGQGVIFYSVKTASSKLGTSKREQELTIARRLFTVVLSDFLCWFPVGLMGILARQGVPISGVVNVWIAIFVLPLNSALNPFLYTINGLAERIERRREEKRLKTMISKLHTEIPKWNASTVEDILKICLRSKRVNKDRVMQWLRMAQNTSNNCDSLAGTSPIISDASFNETCFTNNQSNSFSETCSTAVSPQHTDKN